MQQHVILILLWILFSVFHSVFALPKWKTSMQRLMKNKYPYYRIVYSAFALITLILVVAYNFTIKGIQLWKINLPEIIVSVAGMIASSFVIIFYTKKFFFQLSGADIFLPEKKQETLLQSGYYKYVRHPLYTATLVFIWSIFFIQPQLNNLISCLCITVYTVIGIQLEEKKLIQQFGNAYLKYKAETPMLIPKCKNINKYAGRITGKR